MASDGFTAGIITRRTPPPDRSAVDSAGADRKWRPLQRTVTPGTSAVSAATSAGSIDAPRGAAATTAGSAQPEGRKGCSTQLRTSRDASSSASSSSAPGGVSAGCTVVRTSNGTPDVAQQREAFARHGAAAFDAGDVAVARRAAPSRRNRPSRPAAAPTRAAAGTRRRCAVRSRSRASAPRASRRPARAAPSARHPRTRRRRAARAASAGTRARRPTHAPASFPPDHAAPERDADCGSTRSATGSPAGTAPRQGGRGNRSS